MRYLPHTDRDVARLLKAIGVASLDDLFADVPQGVQNRSTLDLEPALDEPNLMQHLDDVSKRNSATEHLSFLGGGMYDHHIPPAVDQLLLRSEFYTAYTPYQAEVAQGTLQSIYEFQTFVGELFDLPVANASMYDGASAAAEAALMAKRITKRPHLVVSEGLHPEYLQTIQTYLSSAPAEHQLQVVPLTADGVTDPQSVQAHLNEQTAAVILGYPNVMGQVEALGDVCAVAKQCGALCISATTEPYALSLVEAPGALGVDVAVGEGQALAVPPQFGGPGVGLFACQSTHLRNLPGRVVGETVDRDGNTAYVLTLNTREQHIRRERATSNICTNHGLCALAMTIRMSLLGRSGFAATGQRCLNTAHDLRSRLQAIPGLTLPHGPSHFNEFVVRFRDHSAETVLHALQHQHRILGGIPLSRWFSDRPSDALLCVTEKHDGDHLDRLETALRQVL